MLKYVNIFLIVFGMSPICYLVSFVYPLYASLIAIETKGQDDDKQWLTYWVIFCFLGLIESFSDVLLNWIPFYYVMKFIFMGYCMHPTYKGATQLYNLVLKKFARRLLAEEAPKSHVEDVNKSE